MTFILNSHNVFDYLIEHDLCKQSEQNLSRVELIAAKNFNLLVTFPENRKLLIKQERYDNEGKTAGEFLSEWKFQEFQREVPELEEIRPFLSQVLHFDELNSIIVFNYLDDYLDLMDFYTKENYFPQEIAVSIGNLLGTIHRATFNCQDYQNYFCQNSGDITANQVTKLVWYFERIEPEIFGQVSADGLKFFALYQRYDSLEKAMTELGNAFIPSCLTHNDLKLNNILINKDWQHQNPGNSNNQSNNQSKNESNNQSKNGSKSIIRLIDWERSNWGDPAFDLGTLIACYLQIWLSSLVISKSLSIEESLRLATIPLEEVQPSIASLTSAYLHKFPEILEHRPDFLVRVVQFTGFVLIQQTQAMIQYEKSFGNTGIAMLQVAKSLLCRPQQSMSTIFGAGFELGNK